MKKSRKIIVFVLLTVFLLALPGFAERSFYPEPNVRPDIPDSAVWDDELGMYISDDLVKNDNGEYVLNYEKYTEYNSGEIIDRTADWLRLNADTTNVLDKKIVEAANATSGESTFYNSYTCRDSEEITEILKTIPVQYLPDLWKSVCEEPGCRPIKLYAMELLLSIEFPYGISDKHGQKFWYDEFNELRKAVQTESVQTLDLDYCGALTLPGVVEAYQSSNSNTTEEELVTVVEKIQPQITRATFDANAWIEQNAELLEAVKTVLEMDYEWVY